MNKLSLQNTSSVDPATLAPIDRAPLGQIAKEEIVAGVHLFVDSLSVPFDKAERKTRPVTNLAKFVGGTLGGVASVLFGLGLGVAASAQSLRRGIQHLTEG